MLCSEEAMYCILCMLSDIITPTQHFTIPTRIEIWFKVPKYRWGAFALLRVYSIHVYRCSLISTCFKLAHHLVNHIQSACESLFISSMSFS